MSRGRPKARVLPDPVLALPQTSRPAMPSGMVRAWTGKGAVMPWEGRTATSSGATPSSSKVVARIGSGVSSSGSELSSSAGPLDGHGHRLSRSLVFADGRPSAAGRARLGDSAPPASVAATKNR